jgi:hypothetical protein
MARGDRSKVRTRRIRQIKKKDRAKRKAQAARAAKE